jgi:hypothetical protein
MGSWMVVVSGALMSMHVLGINLAPLLTVGGISGIVVGLSAQALLGNMISGLNLVRRAAQQHLLRLLKMPGCLTYMKFGSFCGLARAVGQIILLVSMSDFCI